MREVHRLRALLNCVLRKIFGLRKHEVLGDWMEWRIELHDWCASANIFSIRQLKKVQVVGACRTYGGERTFMKGFGEKT